MARRSLAFALLLALACSPAQPQPKPVEAPPPAPDAGGPSMASPARWTLTDVPIANATIKLENGTLGVGEGGERWVEHDDGSFEAATDLAPEPLHGVARGGSGFRFIGKSGAIYEATSALAPVRRTGEPLEGARAVVLGEKVALAIDASGEPLRSTDGGHTWGKVQIGPRDGVLVQMIAVGRDALAIAAPQRFFASRDDGATWRPVASFGAAVTDLHAENGSIYATTDEDDRKYDPGTETFVQLSRRAPRHPTGGKRAHPTAHRSALDGRTAVVVESDLDARSHRVSVFELGQKLTSKHVEALDGCFDVRPAVRGGTVVLSCDAIPNAEGGIDTTPGPAWRTLRAKAPPAADGGHATGMITKLLRSEDGGKTFRDDATVEGGMPEEEESLAIGPDGWTFLGRRCTQGYKRECIPARVRPNAGAPWVELADDAPRQQEFAGHPAQKVVYSVGWSDNETILYKWEPGASAPQSVLSLSGSTARGVSLSLDDAGVVRGFTRAKNATAFEVQGASLKTVPLPSPKVTSGAFAGKYALVSGGDGPGGERLQESTDGGQTWHAVPTPAGVPQVTHCSEDGCLTSRGVRAGWDGASAAAPARATPKPLYAKPLKCKASGAWVALGGGQLPGADNADLGGARWVVPTRDAPGAVTLVSSRWADSAMVTTRTPVVGAAPQPPTYGAATTMHVQSNGVVVLRYSYARARKAPGTYNPVDVQATWWRPNGKLYKAGPFKVDPFRVNKDPQYGSFPTPAYGEPPTILSLGPRGLWFKAPTYSDSETLYHLRDDGRTEKTKLPSDLGYNGAPHVADTGSSTLLVTGADAWTVFSPSDGKKLGFAVLGALDDDDAHVDVLDFGGKPVFFGTLRWAKARAWAIPIAMTPELGAATAMPTQLSLGDVPRACAAGAADPKEQRVILPWVRGARHPVTVEADGNTRVLATGALAARVPASGDACATALEATEDGRLPSELEDAQGADEWSALVFPGDPGGSLLFRTHGADWPAAVSVRPLSCAFEAGPLPKEVEKVSGFAP